MKDKDSLVVFNKSATHLRVSSNFSERRRSETDQHGQPGKNLQLANSGKFYPFYAESTAFVDSNYTFRPNSNLLYENVLAYHAKMEGRTDLIKEEEDESQIFD